MNNLDFLGCQLADIPNYFCWTQTPLVTLGGFHLDCCQRRSQRQSVISTTPIGCNLGFEYHNIRDRLEAAALVNMLFRIQVLKKGRDGSRNPLFDIHAQLIAGNARMSQAMIDDGLIVQLTSKHGPALFDDRWPGMRHHSDCLRNSLYRRMEQDCWDVRLHLEPAAPPRWTQRVHGCARGQNSPAF